MEHNANISIRYEKNCDYNESVADKDITIPLQEIEGFIQFSKFNGPQDDPDPTYFRYTEVLEIECIFHIKDTQTVVNYGEVNFYYTNNYDVTRTKQLINQSPIPIDMYGNAKTLFVPPESGTIEAEYISNDYYDTNICFDTFELYPMVTLTRFINSPPHLTSYEDTIELEVSVIDANDNPVDYGIVTFLNYSTHDINDANDGREKVIGNPVYVENGKAKITYSPIQYESDNAFYGTLELIKAVYNYDNQLYGETWKYYKMSRDYTTIGIYQNNQINLFEPVNANTFLNKGMGGMFVLTQGDTLKLQCNIIFEDNEMTEEDVTFFVAPIDRDAPPYEVEGTYSTTTKKYEGSFLGLPVGLYNVYAYVKPSKHLTGIVSGTPPLSLTTGQHIVDEVNINGAYSNSYYLEIEPKTYTYTLQLHQSTNVISPNQNYQPYITINADNPNLFINEKFYFYVNSTKQRYEGKITKTNNQLVGSLNTPIKFSTIGDYLLYAYIPPVTGKYDGSYSAEYLNIKVRDQLNVVLSFSKDTISYPNRAVSIVKVNNIYNENIDVTIKVLKNNSLVHTYVFENKFTKNNHTQEYVLPLLDAGNYVVKAYISNDENIQQQKNLTISKGTLAMSLNNASKKVKTGIQTDITLGIQEVDGKDIITSKTDIQNKLISVLKHNNINNIPITSLTVNNATDNYYTVDVVGTIYDEGTWGVKLDYVDTNGNYNITDNNFLEFTASNQTPFLLITGDTTTVKQGKITYEQTTDINSTYTVPQYVLIITEFKNNADQKIKFMHITDKQGKFTINKPNNDVSNIAWANYETVEYTVDPQLVINDINIIDAINSKTYNEFVALFNNYNIQFDATQYNNLKTQLNSFNNVNLFLGYGKYTGEIDITY